jgi:6-phosphogluconolactonase
MLEGLAREPLDWRRVHVFQVDERIAPPGHVDRNLTRLLASLAATSGECVLHPRPVETADPERAATDYAAALRRVCGPQAVLDLVHLGLGDDGHTASLVPNDPVLDVVDRDVAVSGEYRGRRRVTLTFPILNRARERLWLVAGAGKIKMLEALLRGDPGIPASRVETNATTLLTDQNVVAR